MEPIIAVLAIFAALVLYAFFNFQPSYGDRKAVGVFNKTVLAVCAMLCLAWFFGVRLEWKDTPEDEWWLSIAIAGALAIEIVLLGLCLVLRNFWIFRLPRRPGF